jgi:ATP-binding cassette subfamily F protein 3
MLERMEVVDAPVTGRPRMAFRFPQPARSGVDVVELSGVSKRYGEHVVYSGVDFRLQREERVALVGPNGAGKTTLLKIIAGALEHEGERLLGYRVDVGYFGQHQVDDLDLDATVLQTVESVAALDDIPRVRGLLGAFLFSGDAVEKRVGVLSGGEKSRLALCRMLLRPANLLLLDEPTNHLDIESRDVLEEALAQFAGTICFVSHDRHFINTLATRVLHVENAELISYPGDYEYYHHKRGLEAAQREALPLSLSAGPVNSRKERRRAEAEARERRADALGALPEDLVKVEAEVARLEVAKEKLQARLADPALYEDPEKSRTVAAKDNEVGVRLDELYQRWEQLGARIEEIESRL